ncbi:serine hydrolase [Actinotalea sp. K2]|uniref:serine hydrolase domain-containing protein n=1 Tax=Actinotalea sp. K2 TaxID=2939438 RepID=UPI0020176DC9|nr:serine hydrolase domain-containing protein [Actinotalea sp. K2]MCL3861716.1 beta-lactamase family protein [Actinotalea sp. K2]
MDLSTTQPSAVPEARAADDALERAVTRVFDEAHAAGVPGTAVSVAVHAPGGPPVRLLQGRAAEGGAELTAGDRFDLASLTKVVVAVAALSLVEEGVVELDAPVAQTLQVGTGEGADEITLRHLLTHTAGLPPTSTLWQAERGQRLLDRVLTTPLEAPPGTRPDYSCLGFVAVGRLLELVTGARLDEILRDRALVPLGAGSMAFGPVDLPAAVATETQPHRGSIRGEVHDELAHALGRPVGNAGLFGTADDVLAVGQMVLRSGEGRAGRVLDAASVELLVHPAVASPAGYGQAAGFRVADATFMGSVCGIGHTGFTGTSLVVDPVGGTVTVLLTNRVHPTRVGTDVGPLRRALAEAVAAVATPHASS